jgi:hypothetical protein
LNLQEDSENFFRTNCPVFDGVDCYRLRALVAVALGCDVNLNSVLTPAPLLAFMKSDFFKSIESNEDKYLAMKKFLVSTWTRNNNKSSKKTKKQVNTFITEMVVEKKDFNEMLDIFVDAFVYEPTNITTNHTSFRQRLTYLHEPPEKILHPYLHAFMDHASTPVVDCCVVVGALPMCIGCGEGGHNFFTSRGNL